MATTRFLVVEENPDTHNFLHVEDEFESTFIWGLFKYLYCQCVVMLQSRKCSHYPMGRCTLHGWMVWTV